MSRGKRGARGDNVRDPESLKGQILDAARDLSFERGLGAVTMRSIAKRVGYSPALLYRYFKNKDDIFLALRRRGFELFFAAQQEARTAKDPVERLRQHTAAYLHFAVANPEIYDLMFITRAPMDLVRARDDEQVTRRSYDLLKEDLVAAMEIGALPATHPDLATIGGWSIAHGAVALLLRQRLVMHDREVSPEMVEAAIQWVFDTMLKSPPG